MLGQSISKNIAYFSNRRIKKLNHMYKAQANMQIQMESIKHQQKALEKEQFEIHISHYLKFVYLH